MFLYFDWYEQAVDFYFQWLELTERSFKGAIPFSSAPLYWWVGFCEWLQDDYHMKSLWHTFQTSEGVLNWVGFKRAVVKLGWCYRDALKLHRCFVTNWGTHWSLSLACLGVTYSSAFIFQSWVLVVNVAFNHQQVSAGSTARLLLLCCRSFLRLLVLITSHVYEISVAVHRWTGGLIQAAYEATLELVVRCGSEHLLQG